ncbi:unnamed protein product [Callosobruchus maculatus]|uniref:Uncharacterized protein n=1 Tax=Callosobruchus maculatus TaxID=64391 RepID=A0A653BKZ7_CALMS|nr:unnamed protein product [Callosobruchus maculatus]
MLSAASTLILRDSMSSFRGAKTPGGGALARVTKVSKVGRPGYRLRSIGRHGR